MLCASSDSHALPLIQALMEHKDKLDFEINKQTGDGQYSALHHASGKGVAGKCNKDVYDYLIKHDANDSLPDVHEKTPRDYFEWAQKQQNQIPSPP